MSTYRISTRSLEEDKFEKTTIGLYNTEATAAASKNMDGKGVPGQLAYGGAVVAPIQAIDAAVVMMMASGESFRRLSAASNGKPYMHTIYDAFKMDANGYDVMLKEVNKNWMNATMDWSYLEEAKASLERATARFNVKAKNKAQSNSLEGKKLTDNEAVYMKYLLEVEDNVKTGKKELVHLVSRMPKFTNQKEFNTRELTIEIYKELLSKGYDILNPKVDSKTGLTIGPTIDHLLAFKSILNRYLNMNRVNALISLTAAKKKELKAEILKRGYKYPDGETGVLQYYGH